MRITTQISQNANRIVRYISSMLEIEDFSHKSKCCFSYMICELRPRVYEIPTESYGIYTYICSMMEIGDFFAQVKVQLFLYDMRITTQNWGLDLTKSYPGRIVHMSHSTSMYGSFCRFKKSDERAFLHG